MGHFLKKCWEVCENTTKLVRRKINNAFWSMSPRYGVHGLLGPGVNINTTLHIYEQSCKGMKGHQGFQSMGRNLLQHTTQEWALCLRPLRCSLYGVTAVSALLSTDVACSRQNRRSQARLVAWNEDRTTIRSRIYTITFPNGESHQLDFCAKVQVRLQHWQASSRIIGSDEPAHPPLITVLKRPSGKQALVSGIP